MSTTIEATERRLRTEAEAGLRKAQRETSHLETELLEAHADLFFYKLVLLNIATAVVVAIETLAIVHFFG